MLCPSKRKKKQKNAKSGKRDKDKDGDSGSISSASSPRAAYKQTVGVFSPGKLREISSSFAQERDDHNASRLFVCSFEGCNLGLRGAPSRFSGEGYLRSHMLKKHGVTLQPMDAALVKDLKSRQQQRAVAKDCESPASHNSVAEGDGRDSPSIHRDRLPMHECRKEMYDGDFLRPSIFY